MSRDSEKKRLDDETASPFTDLFTFLTRSPNHGEKALMQFPENRLKLQKMNGYLNASIESTIFILQGITAVSAMIDLGQSQSEEALGKCNSMVQKMANLLEVLFSWKQEVEDRLGVFKKEESESED